jgi:hypothetical protein
MLGFSRAPAGRRKGRSGFSVSYEPRVLEVYREPTPDAASPFGWRYARREALEVSAQVTPLAAPGSSVPVSRLFP